MKKQLRFFLTAVLAALCVTGVKAQAPTLTYSAFAVNTDVYVYNISTGKFINDGGAWKTQAVLIDTPLRFQWKAVDGEDGVYGLYAQEAGASAQDKVIGKPLKLESNADVPFCFLDGASTKDYKLKVTSVGTNVYKIQSASAEGENDQCIGANTYVHSQGTFLGAYFNQTYGDACQWAFVTVSDYARYQRELKVYYMNQASISSPISYTSALNSPTCDNATGWSTTGTASDHNRLKAITDAAKIAKNNVGFTTAYVEFWNGTPDAGDVYYTLESMPAGFYRLTADMLDKNIAEVTTRTSFFIADNDVPFASEIASAESRTYYGRLANEGTLTFGWRLSGEKEWLGIDNIELEYIGQPNTVYTSDMGNLNQNVVISGTCASLQLSDGPYNFSAASGFTATEVGYNRSFTADQMSTVCLPFALTAEEVAAAGTFYELAGFADNQLHFTEVITTEANKPYLFKANTTGAPFAALNGKTIAATPAEMKTTVSGAALIGTYTAQTLKSGSNTLYGYKTEDGTFVQIGSSNGAHINPFRAYISIPGSASVKALNVAFDDETTGIKTIDNGQCIMHNEYFDLSGRRIVQPTMGLYIVNGKKVLVK